MLASCWEGRVLARLFLPEDLACLFVIHLIYWPGSWLAAVSLILLFAAAAGMTLYQRRYLGGIKDSTWVFAVFALLRLLAEKDTLKAAVEAYPVKDGTEAVLAMIEDVQAKRKRAGWDLNYLALILGIGD